MPHGRIADARRGGDPLPPRARHQGEPGPGRRAVVMLVLPNREAWQFEARPGRRAARGQRLLLGRRDGHAADGADRARRSTPAETPRVRWRFERLARGRGRSAARQRGARRRPPVRRAAVPLRPLPCYRAAPSLPPERPMPSDLKRVTRALLSVSDKTGLVAFARALARARRRARLDRRHAPGRSPRRACRSQDVSDLTGFPEMMDGRVKTLHPAVHGGLLGVRANPEHQAAMLAHGIAPIDLLVVNLYPFEATRRGGHRRYDECIENIDIGGPAMIRAAAKNHGDVAVVVDGADYAAVLADLDAHGGAVTRDPAPAARRRRPSRARPPTTRRSRTGSRPSSASRRRASARSAARSPRCLRYGENPHQAAAFYRTPETAAGRRDRPAGAGQAALLQQHQRHRRGLRMRRRVRPGATPAPSSIVKHANPCGVAEGETLARGLREGAALRSRLGLRRHRRAEPRRSTRTRRARSSRSSPR